MELDHGRYLDMTLAEAELARQDGAAPVGAVIVAPDGTVLSRGRNRVLSTGDQTAHAEVDAIRAAGAAIAAPPDGGWLLYTSAEPCLMCLGAILLCPIQAVIWAAGSQTGGASATVRSTGYQRARFDGLRAIAEPSPAHRARSRRLLDAFAGR